MTIELVKILEAAKEHYDKSHAWFELYQESECETYWTACSEEDYAARGLLEAYEILTGEKIYPHEIEEHIAQVC